MPGMLLWPAAAFALLQAGVFLAVCLCAKRRFSPGPADAIVIPGARVLPGGQPSNALKYRLNTAAEAYFRGFAKNIIVCGARGEDESVTEAFAMRAALARAGVPARAVFLEETSRNTRENLQNAARIMAREGFTSCLIITSDYHMTRALFLAGRLGLAARGMKAPSPARPYTFVRGRAREAVSWQLCALSLLRGKIKR